MPRKLRGEYPGAIYHLMNRGDRREAIFKDDEDRKLFLTTLGVKGSFPAIGKLNCFFLNQLGEWAQLLRIFCGRKNG